MLKSCAGFVSSLTKVLLRWTEEKESHSIWRNLSDGHIDGMDEHDASIIWSPEAIADLDGIWDYYEDVAGIRTAENMTQVIHHRCSILVEHPLSGRDRNALRPGLQSVVASPFVIFYKIRIGARPEIVRVIDGRRDIEAELGEGGH
jgi:toxin ParE1/3/4